MHYFSANYKVARFFSTPFLHKAKVCQIYRTKKAEIAIAYLEVNQDVLERSFNHSSLSQNFSEP